MTHKSLLSVLLFAMAVIASPAAGQNVKAYRGEIVVTTAGELVAPWIEIEACVGGTSDCRSTIINKETKEVARFGDRWASQFEPTGNGREVHRAETALDKAIRLSR